MEDEACLADFAVLKANQTFGALDADNCAGANTNKCELRAASSVSSVATAGQCRARVHDILQAHHQQIVIMDADAARCDGCCARGAGEGTPALVRSPTEFRLRSDITPVLTLL